MAKEFVLYAGRKFWLQSSGRYFQSGVKADPERLLHRRVWLDNFGPIPDGMHVHHKDEDWRNNAPDNLEVKTAFAHRSEHAKARWEDPEMSAVMRAGLARGVENAPAWHASPEGLAWHSKNGAAAWENRKMGSSTCKICSKPFDTYYPERAFLCSKACANQESKLRYREDRKCPQCGLIFNVFAFSKSECCSRLCGTRRLHGHPPTEGRPPAPTKAQAHAAEKTLSAICEMCGAVTMFSKYAKRAPATCSDACRGARVRKLGLGRKA